MNNSNRNVIISAVMIVVILCCCFCGVAAGSTIFWGISQQERDATQEPAHSLTIPTKTPSPASNSDPQATSDSSDSTISPFVAAQMDQIEADVSGIRGLTANAPTSRTLLTPDELKQRVLDDFLAEYTAEEALADSQVLAAFGLLEAGFDLQALYIELFSEQIAGFYDDETKTMYVVQEESFSGPQRLTYSHEFVHALQDQAFDLRDGLNYNDESCEEDSERCAAVQALIEGDASYTELNWFSEYGTAEDQAQIMEFYNSYQSPVFDGAPDFLQKDFIFPYQEGMVFVQAIHNEGGWDAVDRAFAETPVSTEQILHPEKYPSDVPIDVSLPDISSVIGGGWVELDQGVMGEWYTYLILAHGFKADAQIVTEQAQAAAAGWGGDRYLVYHHTGDNNSALILKHIWDTPADAAEFFEAFTSYANGRFGSPSQQNTTQIDWQADDGYHQIRVDGLETVWILAPDQNTAQAIWEAIE